MHNASLWWQCGVIYHIYPGSFMDSNDGVGDRAGIARRLDYLAKTQAIYQLITKPSRPQREPHAEKREHVG